MGDSNSRRKSLDPNRLQRNSEGNIRIHLQSTKANCRNRSLISTTDSLKLYEDQIIFNKSIFNEVDEASLLKRPLSLCFDLGSSGEETNATDTSSSSISSMSSSSSSSANSKSSYGALNRSDYEPFLEDEHYKGIKSNFYEDCETDSDRYSFTSADSSANESVISVIAKKGCTCSPIDSSQFPANNLLSCDCGDNFPNRRVLFEQSYDLDSIDDLDLNKIDTGDYDSMNNNRSEELEISTKEVADLIKIFNQNAVGMRMFEDDSRSLIGVVKIFVNLSDPVRMESPTHSRRASHVFDKSLFPRGGFELVNIDRSTTCKEIIQHLFEKFHIQENYSNYALFEHTVRRSDKDYVKRLGHDFQLLDHLINMARIQKQNFTAHFQCKRYVLQENETTKINWSTFSKTELLNFLRILEKEEKERRERIMDFYSDLRRLIECQMRSARE